MQYNNAADPVAYCRQIEQALEKTHACTGGGNHGSPQDRLKSREQMVVELLEQYLG